MYGGLGPSVPLVSTLFLVSLDSGVDMTEIAMEQSYLAVHPT